MRLPARVRTASIELAMTPMIDVVFLLLVFFLWTSSFDRPEFDLPSALSAPAEATGEGAEESPLPPPVALDELVVRIARRGDSVALELSETPVPDVASLGERLREIASLGVQPPVIIAPEADVPVRFAVEVYDHARAAGFDQVLFAATEPLGEEGAR